VVEGIEGKKPFPINSRVVHEKWEEGLVQRYEDAKVVILFNEVEYKTLDVELVIERGLLEVAQ
jgi:ATP-dependent DNA helicase RecQ